MALKTVKKEVPDEVYEHESEPKKIEIFKDQHPLDPREWDNTGTMVCSHKRYDLGDEDVDTELYGSWEAVEEKIRNENDVEVLLPLYLLDHSGIRISTSPFRSSWDSGKVGFIYVTEKEAEKLDYEQDKEEKLKEALKAEVETYDKYLKGEVYRFVYYERESDEESSEWIQKDSCGGFYGTDHTHLFEAAGCEKSKFEKTGGVY